ncbi:MAG: hypothetical protein WCD86_28125 [Ktedonobacteraceae bacterium]
MSSKLEEPVYHLTPRDLICLTWIGLQYAIRLDQLQRLLFRHTPELDRYKLKPGADRLSLDRTYEILAKWLALGLIEKKMILHGDKLWIWLSREGLRTCQLPFSSSGQPSSVRLPHLFYVNQIRLAIEARRPDDTWTSERQIRRDMGSPVKGESQPHVPDAVLHAANGKVTALEIERTSKTESELLDDLRELAVSYTSIWYFATTATRRQLEATLSEMSAEMRKPFRLYCLVEYGGTAYGIS